MSFSCRNRFLYNFELSGSVDRLVEDLDLL